MFLREEYTRTIKGGSPAQAPQDLPGFWPVGGEGHFGGRTGQLEMRQAEVHYLWRQPSLREHKI
jgi:hypothetical protein